MRETSDRRGIGNNNRDVTVTGGDDDEVKKMFLPLAKRIRVVGCCADGNGGGEGALSPARIADTVPLHTRTHNKRAARVRRGTGGNSQAKPASQQSRAELSVGCAVY